MDGQVGQTMKYEKVKLLNIEFDNLTMDELLRDFNEGVLSTMHVDSIMRLQKDRELYDLVKHYDVITCDSQILYFASKLLGTPLKERVSGSDYFPRFYEYHKDNPDITIFICGGREGVAEIAQENVNTKVGREMIVGTYSPPFDFDQNPDEIDRMVERINASQATVLMLCLSAGKQEKFLVANKDRFTHARMILPLGGTVDYEAQALKRPPAWVTDMGFEWLYRLVKEPRQRWHRYVVHEPPVLWQLLKQRLGLYRNPFGDDSDVPSNSNSESA